jgi:hypothetical protein
MATTIKWGKLVFKTDSKVVHSVDGLSAKAKQAGDDSKSKKKKNLSMELEEVSFTIKDSLALGGNPMNDYHFLRSYIGKAGNMRIGTIKWKGTKFKLQSVELTNSMLDVRGNVVAAEIKLGFIEDNANRLLKLTRKKIRKGISGKKLKFIEKK